MDEGFVLTEQPLSVIFCSCAFTKYPSKLFYWSQRAMAVQEKSHNTGCKSEFHNQHLCYIYCHKPKIDIDQLEDMLIDAEYACSECLRMANSKEKLCQPIRLGNR